MRWLFLLLGLALGFGLALALLHDAPEPVELELEIAPSAPIPKEEFMRDYSERGHIAWGRVVMNVQGVDFEPTVYLLGKTVFGAPLEYCDSVEEHDDDVVSVEGRAGRYLAWWRNKDAERVGVRVLVASERETRITPKQGRLLPLADGLGRLDVRVVGLRGTPLAELEVELKGNGASDVDEAFVITTSTGRCRFEVLPGDYYLEIGHATLEASVRRGEITRLDVVHGARPSGYGDLEIARAPQWNTFELVTTNNARISPNGGDRVFRFLEPGTYRLRASIRDDDVGVIEIRPNERLRIDCPFPTGSLFVQLQARATSPNANVHVVVSREGDANSKMSKGLLGKTYNGSTFWKATWFVMEPGQYSITVTAADWKTVKTKVSVSEGESEVVLQLTPK